jgi:hypothetical protein
MEIRPLIRTDAEAFSLLRREALQSEALAFTESLAEHNAKSPEQIAASLGSGHEENFVVGAFKDAELVGITGFFRLPEERRGTRVASGVSTSSQNTGEKAWRNHC